MQGTRYNGFTLIELSVVLVVIALVVGGILVGQTVVENAKIRAQLSQIDRYKAAVNTFKLKYNAVPGDVTLSKAAAFGFVARSGGLGNGDGNGQIGWLGIGASGGITLGGETVLFWTDLSSAGLTGSQFSDSSDTTIVGSTSGTPPLDFSKYVPRAKVGQNGFIFAFGNYTPTTGITGYQGLQFEISQPISATALGINVNSALTAAEAASIDSKVDDGQPMTGTVVAAAPALNAGGGLGQLASVSGPSGHGFIYCLGSPTSYNVTQSGGNVVCNLMLEAE